MSSNWVFLWISQCTRPFTFLPFPLVSTEAHFFLFWTPWLPRCRSWQPGSSSGPETTPNNQERPEQKRECFNGVNKKQMPWAQREGTAMESSVSMTFWPWDALFEAQNHPCSVLETGRAFLQCSQSSWVLALFELVPQLHLSLFPICFLVKWFKDAGGGGQ